MEARNDITDSCLECDVCGGDHQTEYCPELGLADPGTVLEFVSRARLTLPDNMELVEISEEMLGVCTKVPIPPKTQLGPFEAKRTSSDIDAIDFFILKMFNKDGSVTCFDTSDENECNWMCLIRPADCEEEQNCMAYTINHNVFYSTTRDITPMEELRVWYAPHYAKKLCRDPKPNGRTRSMLGALLIIEAPDVPVKSEPVDPASPQACEPPEPEPMHKCPTCGDSFINDSEYAKHLRSHLFPERSDKGPFKCKRCPNKYKKLAGLKVHMLTHTKKHVCRICNFKANSEPNLQLHIDTKHLKMSDSEKGGNSQESIPRDVASNSDTATDVSSAELAIQEAAEGIMSLKKSASILAESFNDVSRINNNNNNIVPEPITESSSHSLEDASTETNDSTQLDSGEKNDDVDKQISTPQETEVEMESTAEPESISSTEADTPEPDLTQETESISTPEKQKSPTKRPLKFTKDAESTKSDSSEPMTANHPNTSRGGRKIIKTTIDNEIINKSTPKRKIDSPTKKPTLIKSEPATAPTRILPRRALKGKRTTGKLAVSDEDSISPKKIKIEKPDNGEYGSPVKKGRGRPRLIKIDEKSTVENGGQERQVMQGEEIEFYLDDETADVDFQPVKDDEISDDEIEEIDEHVDEENIDFDDSVDFKPPRKPGRKRKRNSDSPIRRRRKGGDTEILALQELATTTVSEDGMKFHCCGKCGKTFSNWSYLRLHLPAHTDRFKCQECGKRFTRNESLLKHVCSNKGTMYYMKEKENENDGDIYCCIECNKEFTEEDYVIKHYAFHMVKFKCKNCDETFTSEQKYNSHTENGCSGTAEKRFSCEICKQSFKCDKSLYRHMAMHTDLYQCEKCSKKYSRKDSWQSHILRCMPDSINDHKIYVCHNCKKTFATELGANNHMVNCSKHYCSECRTAFQSDEELASHNCNKNASESSIAIQFQCMKCDKSFSSNTYLKRHQAMHQGAFECPVCHKGFSRIEEQTLHYRFCLAKVVIGEKGEIECEVCSSPFKDSKAYRDHYQEHTHPFQCTACLKRFIKVGTLHSHKCELPFAVSVTCHVCGKSCRNEKCLLRHLVIHGEPQFQCQHCSKMFYRSDYLKDHVCLLEDGTKVRIVRKRNQVTVKKTLVCDTCGHNFNSVSNFNKHVKIHGEKNYECDICGKKFHFENYIKLHREMVHEKKFSFQCSYCGKIVTSKAGLVSHIKQFHTANPPTYKCPKCEKVFKQRGNLRTHLLSHGTAKNYGCDICGMSFKYPEQRNRHKLEHTMVNKFECEFCDKKFVRQYDLKRHHENFHSGIVYICDLCNERCAHKASLIRHFKRKHANDMHLVRDPDILSNMRKRTADLISVKSEPKETTILLEAVQQLEQAGLVDQQTTYVTQFNNGENIILPQEAAEALQDLSNAVITTNHLGEETITIPSSMHSALGGVECEDGEQTVVILQIINQEDQEVTEEVVDSCATVEDLANIEYIQQEGVDVEQQVEMEDGVEIVAMENIQE